MAAPRNAVLPLATHDLYDVQATLLTETWNSDGRKKSRFTMMTVTSRTVIYEGG